MRWEEKVIQSKTTTIAHTLPSPILLVGHVRTRLADAHAVTHHRRTQRRLMMRGCKLSLSPRSLSFAMQCKSMTLLVMLSRILFLSWQNCSYHIRLVSAHPPLAPEINGLRSKPIEMASRLQTARSLARGHLDQWLKVMVRGGETSVPVFCPRSAPVPYRRAQS